MFIDSRTGFKYLDHTEQLLFKRNCIIEFLDNLFHRVKLDNYYLICRMKYLLPLFLLFSILISSCTTSNKVVSSSFIQKRKYNKGYHFDLASHKAISRQQLVISQKQSSKKTNSHQPITISRNPIPEKMKNLPGNENNLNASINNEVIVFKKLNDILMDGNRESSNNDVLNEPPKRSTAQILKDISIALLILLIVTFSLIFIPQTLFMISTTKLIFRVLLILEILSFLVAAAYHYKTRKIKNSHALISESNNNLSASVDNGMVILSNQKDVLADESFIQQNENANEQQDN